MSGHTFFQFLVHSRHLIILYPNKMRAIIGTLQNLKVSDYKLPLRFRQNKSLLEFHFASAIRTMALCMDGPA